MSPSALETLDPHTAMLSACTGSLKLPTHSSAHSLTDSYTISPTHPPTHPLTDPAMHPPSHCINNVLGCYQICPRPVVHWLMLTVCCSTLLAAPCLHGLSYPCCPWDSPGCAACNVPLPAMPCPDSLCLCLCLGLCLCLDFAPALLSGHSPAQLCQMWPALLCYSYS